MSDTELIDTPPEVPVPDITIKNGFNFGPAARAAAFVIFPFSLLVIATGGIGIFIGPVFLFIAGFALTSRQGVQISYQGAYLKEYNSVFGLRNGKWISTHGLPDICVLKLGMKQTLGQYYSGTPTLERDVSINEVYLMSANHRKRILVKKCKNKAEAVKFAEGLAAKMKKNFVPFNPQISEQTKARRR